MQPDGGVGGPGAASDKTDPRPAGQLAIGLGHDAGAAFLAADHELDAVLRIVEGVESRQIALPRHAEGQIDPVNLQLIDQDLATGPAAERFAHGIPRK